MTESTVETSSHGGEPVFSAGRRIQVDEILRQGGTGPVEAISAYLEHLPRPAIARCPHSGVIVNHSIDTGGIDGPWWFYRWPQRPVEQLPTTFFAFTGAVRLSAALPDIPILVKPGPEAPYVVPRLLGLPGLRAVLGSLKVGGLDAWTITYFSDREYPVERFNDWGACRYWLDGGPGVSWDSMTEDAEPLDFDLAPWIERGALQWIAPGDAELVLQSSSDGCPYLDLPGRRSFLRVQYGVAWDPASMLPPSGKTER